MISDVHFSLCFFFQAEDGIRDGHVTGVQTCALPILLLVKYAGAALFCAVAPAAILIAGWVIGTALFGVGPVTLVSGASVGAEIGRASCRERGGCSVEGGSV